MWPMDEWATFAILGLGNSCLKMYSGLIPFGSALNKEIRGRGSGNMNSLIFKFYIGV